MPTNKGMCRICGKVIGKTAIKRHILKEHNNGDERCLLIKAEGAYRKDYWLFFSVPIDSTLSTIDDFLRAIWCECCDHLSNFSSIYGKETSMSLKLSAMCIGDKLLYEYDFGSTTAITITIVDIISRKKQNDEIELLARNKMKEYVCKHCGGAATFIDVVYSYTYLCDECSENDEDIEFLLPITNSPRCGVCGYEGEHDYW